MVSEPVTTARRLPPVPIEEEPLGAGKFKIVQVEPEPQTASSTVPLSWPEGDDDADLDGFLLLSMEAIEDEW